jgi:hypothetical protein
LTFAFAGDERLLAIGAKGQAERVPGDGGRESGGGKKSALRQNGGSGRIVLRVGVHGGHVEVRARHGANAEKAANYDGR